MDRKRASPFSESATPEHVGVRKYGPFYSAPAASSLARTLSAKPGGMTAPGRLQNDASSFDLWFVKQATQSPWF
jgi:hypothetical protein